MNLQEFDREVATMAVPSPSHHTFYKNGAEFNQSKVSVALSPVSESPLTSPLTEVSIAEKDFENEQL